jgi:3-oxoacyl-[acyl-carrier protein] reductase
LTALVNNAGVGSLRMADILETQPDSGITWWIKNVKAVFFLTQTFAKHLMPQRRSPDLCYSISIISSVSAFVAYIDKATCYVSKFASGMGAKTFAQRLAAEGIQVFFIQPVIIETELSRPVLQAYGKMIKNEETTLMSRFGRPHEVGSAVAESLHWSRWFEPTHSAFSPTRRLMRNFGSSVEPATCDLKALSR